MTTLSSDTDNGASAGARIYSQVMELEKQLKAQIKEKRAFHPDVRNIRAKLREKYVEIILTDYEVSEKHDIATSLWHFVYYNMIEEFRTRIRYAASAPVPGAKVPTQRVSPQKLLAEFKNFISEATKFYNALILKLKKKYGLPQADLAFEGPEFNLLANKQLTEVKRSCHRLFIHLGDLARYKELHSDGDNYAPDWKVPASYYYKAVSLWPSTGHPHNQLAVLATYMRNDFLAVYHYFRSLAVDDPFTTARGNLILLFERNRQQYAELSDQKGLADVQKKGRTGKEGRNSSSSASPVKAKIEVKDTESDSKKSFFVRFVRLNGILFTKTSLETFPEVYSDTVRDLEKLLSLDLATLKALFISDLQNPAVSATGLALGALQVVSILMFSVPNGNSRSTYADAVQHSTVSKHALTAAFKIAGCFMSTCAKSKAASGSPLLPASLVFMEWLRCRQEMLVGNGVEDDKQSNARTFFWKESLVLLNSFCDGDNSAEPNNHVALWEDHELRGFTPLLPAHLTLDFSRRQPTNEETQVRVQRFVAAGKAVARALDGSGKGLVFDEDMGRFLLAGERRERRPKEKVLLPKAVDKAVDKQVIDSNPHPVPQVAEPALVSAPSLSLAAVEDEEEVIVFKPVAKGTPVAPEVKQNDLYGSLGIPAGVGTEVSASFKTEVHEGQQSAVASGGSNLDYGSISDSLKNIPMQAPTTAFERPAIPSFMTSLHASSMPMANGAGTVSSGYPFSSNKFDGFQARYAGLSYGTSSTNHQAGVIGQPKENPLASNLMIPQSVAGDVPRHSLAESAGSFNTPSAYPSSLAQDLLYKLQNVTVGKENPEASFARQTASGYGTQTERIPVVEKANTELVRPPVSIGDIVKDGSNAVRAGQASVRPPPGFGPIPLRAVGGNKLVSQPAARPLSMDHAIREDNPLLDNAGWLDAYPGGKTAGMPRPLYNTDFGIWSTANNGLPVPKSTSYPFPGMGVRTLQEIEQQQQQSLLQQPQQQVLLQQPSSMQQQSLLQQPSSMQQLYGGWKPESGIHGYDAQQLQLQQLQQQQQQQVLQQQLLRQFRPQDPFVS